MDLKEYIENNRQEIIERVEKTTRILLPNSEKTPNFPALRKPYDAQARVIEAARRSLQNKPAVFIIGEMGTGKTLIGSLIPKPSSKILVLCPSHLTQKWKREIESTRPNAHAKILRSLADCDSAMADTPDGNQTLWCVLSKETAKLSYLWKPAARKKTRTVRTWNKAERVAEYREIITPVCPDCGQPLQHIDAKGNKFFLPYAAIEKKKTYCNRILFSPNHKPLTDKRGRPKICGCPLWSADNKRNRKYALSEYLKKRRAFFDYLIVDECHELKAADSAQGNALGALASISNKKIMLTGTLIGGYATHLYYLLWRALPSMMSKNGHEYKNANNFIARYGVREQIIRELHSDGISNRASKGSSRKSEWNEKPGISPELFTDFLLSSAIFLNLEDLSANLPKLTETPCSVDMQGTQAKLYESFERDLKTAIREQLARGNRKNLSKLLTNLLAWPDKPFGNTCVDLGEAGLVESPNMDISTGLLPKEDKLVELALEAKERGSKTLVYVQYTNTRDIQPRIQQILERAGLKAAILRSTIKPEKREQWIADNAPDIDCLICNPEIVKTGLDLYDYTTIIYFQTGYNTFTLRQASRRSWRLGQTQECKIFFLYYADTMQHRAIELIAKKINAATALDGKLTSEGLNQLADDDDAFLLAKTLMDGLRTDNNNIVFPTPAQTPASTETTEQTQPDLSEETMETDATKNALRPYIVEAQKDKRPVAFQADILKILEHGAFTHDYICDKMDALHGRPLNHTYDNLQILTARGTIKKILIEQNDVDSFFLYTTIENYELERIDAPTIQYPETETELNAATPPAWTPSIEEIEFDLLHFYYANKRRTIERTKLFKFYNHRTEHDKPPCSKIKNAILAAIDEIIEQRGMIEYRQRTLIALAQHRDGDWTDRYRELSRKIREYRLNLTKTYITDQLKNASLNINALYSDELHAALRDNLDIFLDALKDLETQNKIFTPDTKLAEKKIFTLINKELKSGTEQPATQTPQININPTKNDIHNRLPVIDDRRLRQHTDFIFAQLSDAALELDAIRDNAVLAFCRQEPDQTFYDYFAFAFNQLSALGHIIERPSYKTLWTQKLNYYEPGDLLLFDQIIALLKQKPETAGFMMQQLTGPGTMPKIGRLLDQLEEEQQIVGFTDNYDNEYKYTLKARVTFQTTPIIETPDLDLRALIRNALQNAALTAYELLDNIKAQTRNIIADIDPDKLIPAINEMIASKALFLAPTTVNKKPLYTLEILPVVAAEPPKQTTETPTKKILDIEHYRKIVEHRKENKKTRSTTKAKDQNQLTLFG